MTEPDVGEELLRLEGLEVHFPIRGGLFDALDAAPVGVVRAVDGIDLTIRKGEILGPGRRVGLGQDDDRAASIVKLTRQTGGTDRVRRRGRVDAVGDEGRCATYRRRVQLIFQDPYETLNPKHTIGEFVAEPLIVNNIGASRAERDARGRRGARGRRPAARPRSSRAATRTSCPAASGSAS